MNLASLTIDMARSAVQERKTTALALAEEHYARIQHEDEKIGAFLTLCKERALEQADRVDRMAADGRGAGRDQRCNVDARSAHDRRLEKSGALYSPLRLHRSVAPRGGGSCCAWQDQLRRICHGIVE